MRLPSEYERVVRSLGEPPLYTRIYGEMDTLQFLERELRGILVRHGVADNIVRAVMIVDVDGRKPFLFCPRGLGSGNEPRHGLSVRDTESGPECSRCQIRLRELDSAGDIVYCSRCERIAVRHEGRWETPHPEQKKLLLSLLPKRRRLSRLSV